MPDLNSRPLKDADMYRSLVGHAVGEGRTPDIHGVVALMRHRISDRPHLGREAWSNNGVVMMRLGRYLRELGERAQSLVALTEAEHSFRLANEPPMLVLALETKGELLNTLGNLGASLGAFQEAEALYRNLKDDEGLQRALRSQIVVLTADGRIEEVEPRVRELARLAPGGSDVDKSEALRAQASVLFVAGDRNRAIEILRKRIELVRALSDRALLATAIGDLGLLLLDAERVDDAEKLFLEQQSIAEGLGGVDGLSAARDHLSLVAQRRGDRTSLIAALALQRESERAYRKSHDMAKVARALILQAQLLAQLERWQEARQSASDSAAIARGHGQKALLRDLIDPIQAMLAARFPETSQNPASTPAVSVPHRKPRELLHYYEALERRKALPFWKRWWTPLPRKPD